MKTKTIIIFILLFCWGGMSFFLPAQANREMSLSQLIDEITQRTDELLELLSDNNISEQALKDVISVEEMLYEEFSLISRKVKDKVEKEGKLKNASLLASYVLLSSKYSKLIDRMIELGKKIKLPDFNYKSYIAVMIENSSRSRPQSGHSLADVFYEIPVEGGITRYMLVFPQEKFSQHNLLGPVRSARDYFLFLAQEYDALYIHCGGSPLAYAYFDKYKFKHIDEIHTPSAPFFRDKTRHAPHNLYVYSDKLFQWIKKHRKKYLYGKKGFPFSFSPKLCNGMDKFCVSAKRIFLDFYRHYQVKYIYNEEVGVYERYINGRADVDAFTKKINSTTNLIVQFVKMKVIDKEGRLKVSFVGKGEGLLLQKGRLLKIKWRKDSLFSPTKFFYQTEQLTFLPGKIDIIFFPDTKKKYKKVRWD